MLLVAVTFLAGLFYPTRRIFLTIVCAYWGVRFLADAYDYFMPFGTIVGQPFTYSELLPQAADFGILVVIWGVGGLVNMGISRVLRRRRERSW